MQKHTFLKASAASALIVTLGLITPYGAHAQTSDGSVVNSGDDASIERRSNKVLEIMIRTNQNLDSQQESNLDLNTGGNTSSGNIGSGSMTTGDISAESTQVVAGNESETYLVGNSNSNHGSEMNTTDLVNTGDNTDLMSILNSRKRLEMNTHQDADVEQSTDVESNTGDNKVDGNISPEGDEFELETGSIGVVTEAGANVNQAKSLIDLGEGHMNQTTDTMITNTGDDATVEVRSNSTTEVRSRTDQEADVEQTTEVEQTTGDNRFQDGIGSGSLFSGNAGFMGSQLFAGNSSMTGIGSGWGMPMSYSLDDIVNTGDDLSSETRVRTRVEANLESNQDLSETQEVDHTVETGNNTQEDGIGDYELMSGAAGSQAHSHAEGNQQATVFSGSMNWMLSLLGLL